MKSTSKRLAAEATTALELELYRLALPPRVHTASPPRGGAGADKEDPRGEGASCRRLAGKGVRRGIRVLSDGFVPDQSGQKGGDPPCTPPNLTINGKEVGPVSSRRVPPTPPPSS